MMKISRTLRSHNSIRVTSGFQVRIKCLSIEHVKSMRKKYLDQVRRQYPEYDSNVGGTAKMFEDELFHVTEKNAFCPSEECRLPTDSCAISALTYGVYQTLSEKYLLTNDEQLKESHTLFQKFSHANKKMSQRKHEKRILFQAFEALKKAMNLVATTLEVSVKGPHQLHPLLKKTCLKYRVQISVYAYGGRKRTFRWPENINLSLPHIRLYRASLSTKDISVGHIIAIKKETTIFGKSFGYPCDYCYKRVITGKYHRCRGKNANRTSIQCLACLRQIINPEDEHQFQIKKDPKSYCIRTVYVPEKCEICNLTTANDACRQKHSIKSSCGRGISCPDCNKYLYFSSKMKTAAALFEDHHCFWLTCPLCRESYDPDPLVQTHQCLVKTTIPPGNHPRIIAFDLETYQTKSSEACEICLALEMNYMQDPQSTAQTRGDIKHLIKHKPEVAKMVRCSEHLNEVRSDSFHRTNMVCAVFESKTRGHFHRICFYDPELEHPKDGVAERNHLIYNYIPEGLCDGSKHQKFQKKSKVALATSTEFVNSFSDDLDISVTNVNTSVDAKKDKKVKKFIMDKAFKKQPALTKFVQFIAKSGQFENSVLLSHNGSGFDNLLVAQALTADYLDPEILSSGLKILQIKLPKQNIRFLDSMKYIAGPLSSFPKTFDLPEIEKGDFPHEFNKKCNYNYDGPLPDFAYYQNFNDTPEKREEKMAWWKEHRHDRFNFKYELDRYCKLDVDILIQSLVRHVHASFVQQVSLHKITGDPFPDQTTKSRKCDGQCDSNAIHFLSLYHIYGSPFLTLSSFVYGIWRAHFLENALHVVPDEGGTTQIKTSKKEMEWVSFIESENPDKKLYSAYTSNKPKAFGRIIPDLYVEDTHEIFQFHGCYFHGCTCVVKIPGITWESQNFRNEKFSSLRDRTLAQKELLIENYNFEEKNIHEMWECQYDKLKTAVIETLPKEDQDLARRLQTFLNDYYVNRPLNRLAPREAMRGGRTETYALAADFKEGYELAYVDYSR